MYIYLFTPNHDDKFYNKLHDILKIIVSKLFEAVIMI